MQWKYILFAALLSLQWTQNQIEDQRVEPASSKKKKGHFFAVKIPPFPVIFLVMQNPVRHYTLRRVCEIAKLVNSKYLLSLKSTNICSFSPFPLLLTHSCHWVGDCLDGKVSEIGFTFCILHSVWHNEHFPLLLKSALSEIWYKKVF